MFSDQVNLAAQVPTVLYLLGLVATLLAIAGIFFLDAGLSRAGNVMHTIIQKLCAALVAAAGMSVIGFGIWDIQFSQAFGVPNPVWSSIKLWWIGGHNITTLPQHLDPAATPGADSFQAFYAVFVLFSAFLAALLSGSVIERVKTGALAMISLVFGGLIIPIAEYLVYGSVGPLSNSGTHEFGGAFFYILTGCWALILVWRARPRLGVFGADDDRRPVTPPIPHNLAYTAFGLTLFLGGLTGYVLLNGYLVPGAGYFGISMSDTGMGMIVSNLMVGFGAAGVGGLVVWKLSGNAYFLLISPVAGWVGLSGLIDVTKPWQAAITAFFAPFVAWAGYKLMSVWKLDDAKVVPLTLLPGIYSVVMTAAFATGKKQGGYFGLKGEYAFQHSSITIGHQLLGVVVFLAFGLVSALLIITAVERIFGLRDKRVDTGHDSDLDVVVIGLPAYPAVPAQHATGPADLDAEVGAAAD